MVSRVIIRSRLLPTSLLSEPAKNLKAAGKRPFRINRMMLAQYLEAFVFHDRLIGALAILALASERSEHRGA
jgi:hypothetical protein